MMGKVVGLQPNLVLGCPQGMGQQLWMSVQCGRCPGFGWGRSLKVTGRLDSRIEACNHSQEKHEISQILLNRGCPNPQPGLKDIINASTKAMR